MKLLKAMAIAFSIYSKIPVPQFEWKEEDMEYMMCFFPWIGGVIGLFFFGWAVLCEKFAVGNVCYALIGAAIPLMISGGFHVDGYMDTMDAFHSYQSREKKLEILKDPHTGAFAVMGCMAYLLLTFALWTQPQGEFCLLAAKEMAVGYVFSRAMSAAAVVTFPCAKNSGLAHSFSSAAQKDRVRIISILFALVCAVCFVLIHPVLGAAILAGCLMVFWYYHHMAMKQFGGVTGDLAGWFLQVNEIVILIVSVVYSLIA